MELKPTTKKANDGKAVKTKKPIKLKISKIHKPEELGLEEWQRTLRKQYGVEQKYRLENTGSHPIFSDFLLTNPQTEKSYKLAIRGDSPGDNFCSCPDFKINNLGTCKHLEFTLFKLIKKKGVKKAFSNGYKPPYSEIYLSYGLKREIRFKPGKEATSDFLSAANIFFDSNGILKDEKKLELSKFIGTLQENNGHEVRCYDDVMSYIAEYQDSEHRRKIIAAQFKKGIHSSIFKNIIQTQLYSYQREGALFAVKAGRSLIGDDMGLGKTIQALTASELMAKIFNIQKVLIISPTSLKHQWKSEIEKFTKRSVEVIEGVNSHRKELYRNESFYKLVNYELVFRDMEPIRDWSPDLIILDEAQRIKNWQTRIAKSVKQLESAFAIVLTGTPIENRIEELHSIMEFIDRHHFGPLYRFTHTHRMLDDDGKVIGYQNLQSIRESLKTIMIRRKKDEVLKQLPERIDKNFFVPMTKEQNEIHEENYSIVVKLVAKWRRFKFLCEADQKRLQMALNNMRMASDNTYLVDKKTIHGPKIEELEIILREIVVEGGEKVVIFSQWIRMQELVEQVLTRNNIGYVNLNGSVPSNKRKEIISRFKEDPACKVFLSTDAGGVGLNLQSAANIINLDIPWNPAVLEQRIARVHRLGQHKTVRVINFVSSNSIEERILELLKFKKSLFTGALDKNGEDIVMVGESQLKKLMNSVETITEGIEKRNPELEKQKLWEEEQANKRADEEEQKIKSAKQKEKESPVADNNAGEKIESLSDLFVSGAQVLMNLSNIISRSKHQGETVVDSLIGKDEKSGRSYLKIPIPDTEIINNLFTKLGKILESFTGKGGR